MKLALLADVHGNLEALDAVLRHIDAHAPGARIACAGDVVGYGPDPEACLERLLARDAVVVRGNHEEMVLGLRDTSRCVAAGILAVAWTRRALTARAVRALRALPAVATVDGVVVCHGDLDDAGTYVSDDARAAHALARLRALHPDARALVCGHTHTPMAHGRASGARAVRGGRVALDAGDAWLVNPGAVGQARDGVARARFALFDVARGAVTFESVPYDHMTTTAKLRDAGLVPRVTLTPPIGLVRRHVERVRAAAARAYVRLSPQLRSPPCA